MAYYRTFVQALQPFSGEIEIEYDEPLSRHTTMHVGGPADIYLRPQTIPALCATISAAYTQEIPYAVIGNGSNLLVSDDGYRGVIINTSALRQVQVSQNIIDAQAGIALSQLAHIAAEHALGGFEFAAGIPGSFGGAIFMNAGAYSGEMSQVVTAVTYCSPDGKIASRTDLAFGYRTSFFKAHPEYIILSAQMQLTPSNQEGIQARIAELALQRRIKQPLEFPSAGSVFKRPAGYFAGQLIEQVGLKGYIVGDAQVSEKHAGFIINRGSATCTDIVHLIELIQEKVQKETGVALECEIRVL